MISGYEGADCVPSVYVCEVKGLDIERKNDLRRSEKKMSLFSQTVEGVRTKHLTLILQK